MPIGNPFECIASGSEIAGVPMMLCGSVNWHTPRKTFSGNSSNAHVGASEVVVAPRFRDTLAVVGDSQTSWRVK